MYIVIERSHYILSLYLRRRSLNICVNYLMQLQTTFCASTFVHYNLLPMLIICGFNMDKRTFAKQLDECKLR